MRFPSLFATALAFFLAGAAVAAERPNLLWITSEDNSPYLGCYGDPQAFTPRLDRLAAEGVRYRNAFANSAVCSTARSTLITGLHATSLGIQHHRSRVKIPASFQLYPEHLRAAGYYATNNVKTDYNLAGEPQPWDASSNQAHYKNRPAGRPFFAVFNITLSHESQVAPKEGKQDFRIAPADIVLPPYHPDTPELRRDWANYYDQMTAMDRRVGQLLDELKALGLADDTIVVYCSDHGGALPRGKRNLHDSGTRVPLIVRFPAKWRHLAPAAPGEWVDAPVSFVDLPVTFFSLLGVPIPESYEGRPFLGAAAAAPREHVFLYRDRMDERSDMVRAVRDRGYRYVRNFSPHRPWGQHYTYPFSVMPGMGSWFEAYRTGRTTADQSAYWQSKPSEEFYRLVDDPHELRNLIGSSAEAERIAALREALRAEILASRDTGFLPEGMHARLAGDSTIYDYARGAAYPLERLLDLAERATSRDPRELPALRVALADPYPATRYWGAVGCILLRERAAPAREALRGLLVDDWEDVRTAAAEALGHLGDGDRALDALTGVLASGRPETHLAALNAIEALWRAGAITLAQAQFAVRGREFGEPGERIVNFLAAQG